MGGKRKRGNGEQMMAAMDAMESDMMMQPPPPPPEPVKKTKKAKKKKKKKETETNATRIKDVLDCDDEWSRVIFALLLEGESNNLRRKGDSVMKPHDTIKGVYVHSDEAMDFINETCGDMGEYHHKSVTTAKIVKWFMSRDHYMFPMITTKKTLQDTIGFTNGMYNYHTDTFVPASEDDDEVKSDKITMHYFDVPYQQPPATIEQWNAITPLWYKLISHQLKEKDVIDLFEVFIGRLFWPLGHDNYQMAMFLKGLANTGKSTVIDIIERMFPIGSTSSLSSNQEAIFGLESACDKRVFVCPDLPRDMKCTLDQSLLQSLITGEKVSVPRKGKMKLTMQWQTHMLFGSNYMPNYEDASGSLSRRLLIFLFETAVTERDTNLKSKILKGELSTILLRCMAKYRTFVTKNAGKDILKLLPQSMQDANEEQKEELHPVRHFIANGSEEKEIVHSEMCETSIKEFEKAFVDYQKERNGWSRPLKRDDYATIEESDGFNIVTLPMCKICRKYKPSKEVCAGHYHKRNRTKRVVIVGMQIRVREKTNSSIELNPRFF